MGLSKEQDESVVPQAPQSQDVATEKEHVPDHVERGPETDVGEQRVEIDPEVDKRVRRKLDLHVVPLVMALYLLAFLDRSNIG